MNEVSTREKPDNASTLMASFAERTGLTPERPSPHRYLWTDAFAVCNFLALAQQRHRDAYVELASRLIRQVHRTLGYHRVGDRRQGPLSGLPPREADEQPTVGGLRIGGALDDDDHDDDGQCFHHVTKWMHALNRMGTVTGDVTYHRWARELACTAHSAFVQEAAAGRMYWKMSVDLDRPLGGSTSTARHDPLDALVTYCQLQLSASGGGPDLTGEIYDAAILCEGASWATNDALGIGVLLIDASRVAQLVAFDATRDAAGSDAIDVIDLCDVIDALQPGPLLAHMLEAARVGLCKFVHSEALAQPPEQRSASHELGLAIGLAALPVVAQGRRARLGDPAPVLDRLARYAPLRAQIVSFWRDVRHRGQRVVQRNLEDVMLATALLQDSFVRLT